MEEESEAENRNVGLLVQIDEDRISNIDLIAEMLISAGLDITNKMVILGIISGNAPLNLIEDLQRIDGVVSVREDASFKLPPMDRDTPQ